MDAIREQLNKPLVLGIGAFVLGLFIGLVVLGWNLWPVKYTGAGPKDLREDQKAEYLRMAVEAYAQTQNTAVAVARYQALGEGANKVLTDLISNPGSTPLNAIQSYSIAVGAYSPGAGQPQVTPPAGATAQATSATPAKEPAAAPSLLSRLIPILCGIFLLAAIGVLTVFLLKNRGLLNLPTRTAAPAQPAQPAVARQAAYTDYAEQEQPVAQFMASYKAGDDLFDDSFSIDSPAGEFMGECGVSISETIGVGEPKKVSAFEVLGRSSCLMEVYHDQTVPCVLRKPRSRQLQSGKN